MAYTVYVDEHDGSECLVVKDDPVCPRPVYIQGHENARNHQLARSSQLVASSISKSFSSKQDNYYVQLVRPRYGAI